MISIKNALIILSCMLLVGCGTCQRRLTGWTGGLTYKCSKSGVEYVQSDSGIAVHLNRDGSPVTCDD